MSNSLKPSSCTHSLQIHCNGSVEPRFHSPLGLVQKPRPYNFKRVFFFLVFLIECFDIKFKILKKNWKIFIRKMMCKTEISKVFFFGWWEERYLKSWWCMILFGQQKFKLLFCVWYNIDNRFFFFFGRRYR